MTSINVPTSGILRRTGVDVDVIVGRFDQIDKQVCIEKIYQYNRKMERKFFIRTASNLLIYLSPFWMFFIIDRPW